MINIKQAFIIKDKVIALGDNIKLTFYDGQIREGILTNIDTRYKAVTITINDETFHIGYYPLNVNFEFIKNIEKIEEFNFDRSDFPIRKIVKVKGKVVKSTRTNNKVE